MGLLVTDSLAAYTCWGILSAFVPVLKSGSRTWRMPAWLRAAAITLIAWGIPAMPARWAHALACTAVVLLVMITALRLGAALPEPVTIGLPARKRRQAPSQDMRGYTPQGTPGRRVPRLD